MDYYHFVRGTTPAYFENAQRLQTEKRVRFKTPLVGPWDSITILEEDLDVAVAQQTIAELDSPSSSPTNAEDRPLDSTTATSTKFGPQRIRRSEHKKYEAYALITTESSPDEALFAALDTLDGYTGSSMVDGSFDILLLLGGATPEELENRLATFRSTIRGRARAEVCYQPPLSEEYQ
jgi:hypothetical protein